MAAALGADLIFDMQRRRPGLAHRSHRAGDVERRSAETAVDIHQQRQRANVGDAPNVGQHIVQGRNAQIRQPQRTGRHAAAGKVDGLEPGPLGQQRMVGVDRAGDLQGFFFTQGLTKGEPG